MAPTLPTRSRTPARRTSAALCLGSLALVLTLSGCAGSAPRASGTAPASPTSTATIAVALPSATAVPPAPTAVPTRVSAATRMLADLAAGKALLQAQCASCHALSSAGMPGPATAVAPPLDGIGARRSKKWLEIELINPCAHPSAGGARYRCSAMPSYSGLTQQQRDQIVLYLLTQR